MYIHQLQIENLRCFEKARFDFVCPTDFQKGLHHPQLRTPNINLMLGDNGAGKTTLLRAIALTLLGPALEDSGFVPYRLVRRTNTEKLSAKIEAHSQHHEQDDWQNVINNNWRDNELPYLALSNDNSVVEFSVPSVTTIRRVEDVELLGVERDMDDNQAEWFFDGSPAFFVLGYGATRRSEVSKSYDATARSKSRNVRYSRVAGLFEDHVTLIPLESWLPELEDNFSTRFNEVCDLINKLLSGHAQLINIEQDEEEELRPFARSRGEHYLFRFGDSDVPFAALSDGYRAYIGWIGDMLYHLTAACPLSMKLTDCRGVVMVDEIDLHLHPSWQRVVVDTLSQTFPNLQFILTTHSPIVAGTLEPGNIWVMETNDDGSVTPKRYQERIFGLSADQILTSSYFNLLTTRAPHAEAEIHMLAERVGNGDANASLQILQRLTGSIDGEDFSETEIVIP